MPTSTAVQSTATPAPSPVPSPQNPTLRQTQNGVILLMTSLTDGTVVNTSDVSLPLGYHQSTWSGTSAWAGNVDLTQPA